MLNIMFAACYTMYKFLFFLYQKIIYVFFLFLIITILTVYAIGSSVSINVKDNFLHLTSLEGIRNFAVYNNKQYSFNHVEEKFSDQEMIIINASCSRFLPIFTFSPSNYIKSTYSVDDTANYLKNITGFSVIRSGGTNSDPVFRGMRGSRIRLLVNHGEILGACCSRMDPSSAYIYPGTFDILNLIKGPQTVLLGPVSSGGTLQFVRYHPNFNTSQIKLHSNVILGSNSKIDRNIDGIIEHKYGYIRLIGNVSHSDDYHDGNGYKVHSAWYKWNADAILSLNFNPYTFYEISLGQGNGSANYAAKSMDGLVFARENYSIKMETTNITNTLDKIALYSWYNYVNHVMGNNFFHNIDNVHSLNARRNSCCINNVDRCIWGARGIVVNQWENIECHSGIDTQINRHRKIRCDYNWYTDVFTKDTGIFSELYMNISSNNRFVGGVRVEHYKMFDNNCVIYKKYKSLYPAGFIRYESNFYELFPYYIGVGTSKRFPDYWELLHINFDEKNINKNDDILDQQLKPEHTIQLDLGTSFQYLNINGWISSYFGYVKNFILYNNDDLNTIKKNVNYAYNIDARIYGAEAELNYQFNDNWCIKSNMAWTSGININNHCVLPKIPPLEGTFTCQWKYGYYNIAILWRLVNSVKFNMKNDALFTNTIKCNNYINTPGFGIFSINLARINSKYYKFSVGIDNLFNRIYRESTGLFYHPRITKLKGLNIPIYEPGRMWWVKMEITV